MNELEPVKPESLKEEIVIPVKSESRVFVSKVLPRGMTQWEFNLETHEGLPVQIKETQAIVTAIGTQLRHRIDYRKDRYYCIAINLKNATRKYAKWRALNQRVKLLMEIKSHER